VDIYIKSVENGFLVITTKRNLAMIGHEQTVTYVARDESDVLLRISELLLPTITSTEQ